MFLITFVAKATMGNILEAIANMKSYESYDFKEVHKDVLNRIQAVGASLENFVKYSFIGDYETLDALDEEGIENALDSIFEWQGSANNPPDAILRESDAIEIKKLGGANSSIPLNSSYPKDYLYGNDDKLTEECKEQVGDFEKKDFVYVVGRIPSKSSKIKSIWMVYGNCLAADKSVYLEPFEKIKEDVKNVVESYTPIDSKELGRFSGIDDTDRTVMRVRGMFELENPNKAFNTYIDYDDEAEFHCFMICLRTKYNSFPKESRVKIESDDNINVEDIDIPNPNESNSTLEAKLISFKK